MSKSWPIKVHEPNPAGDLYHLHSEISDVASEDEDASSVYGEVSIISLSSGASRVAMGSVVSWVMFPCGSHSPRFVSVSFALALTVMSAWSPTDVRLHVNSYGAMQSISRLFHPES